MTRVFRAWPPPWRFLARGIFTVIYSVAQWLCRPVTYLGVLAPTCPRHGFPQGPDHLTIYKLDGNIYMAYLATQNRPSTSSPSDGSRTITITNTSARPEDDESSNNPDDSGSVGALRLRGGPRKPRQRVAWGEDVVDNEGCGRKSSKSSWRLFPRLCFET